MANDRNQEAWELILKAAQMNKKVINKDMKMFQVGMCFRIHHAEMCYLVSFLKDVNYNNN